MALEIMTTESDASHVITARGEIDLYASPELRQAILKAVSKARDALGIDLSQVEYMDSSGVATLVEGLKSANQRQVAFTLIAPSHAVMKVLSLSRLDAVFTIKESL